MIRDPGSEFDFAVIGGGSAGYAAARTAAGLGLRTAVIDGAEELGGLCILRGCMPSKTLIESANRRLTVRRAAEFGLTAEDGPPDMIAIRERKRRLIADFASYRRQQLADGRFELIRAHAAFLDPHGLQLTARDGTHRALTARAFCLATGSVSSFPDIPGLAESRCWTSDDLLDAGTLPASVAVLGGGAIALEMAHFLEAMGCRVTLIQRSAHLLTNLDPECGGAVRRAYESRGMTVLCGTRIRRLRHAGGQHHVELEINGAPLTVSADRLVLAMGRRPATSGLGLEAAGVVAENGKVTVSDAMQTSCPHIFAAGDVCSALDVVHVAVQQGELAARNARRLLSGQPVSESIDSRVPLFGVFSHPQVAAAGAGEAALQKHGVDYVKGSYPFDDHGKSMVMGETDGFVKMLARRDTGEIAGAFCVGAEATELIHEIAVAMHLRCTVHDFLRIPHYHPTLSEIWTYPAEQCAEQLVARGGDLQSPS